MGKSRFIREGERGEVACEQASFPRTQHTQTRIPRREGAHSSSTWERLSITATVACVPPTSSDSMHAPEFA